jgi:hypothetical protein
LLINIVNKYKNTSTSVGFEWKTRLCKKRRYKMKGSVVQAMKEMIVEKYGAQKWQEALVKAGINKEPLILPSSDIDDQLL